MACGGMNDLEPSRRFFLAIMLNTYTREVPPESPIIGQVT